MRIVVIVTLSQRLEATMPTAATLGKTPAHCYDPIGQSHQLLRVAAAL